ncbi:MAG TPA: methyl-accepting chemotaxis protein [Candidatus Eisenbacteria bacterium]|nr:methyl-accepting chemotaxis protein [Candidatus Eisenbacteria bacterium]
MSDEHDDTDTVSITPGPSRGVLSFSVLGAGIGTGLLTLYCMLFFDQPYNWGGAVAVSLIGGVTAAVLAGVPQRKGEKALLRERDAREEERRAWGASVVDLESLRRQINLATLAFKNRKDPLIEVPELRSGMLHELLAASRDAGVTGPVVSRIAVDEAELIGDMDRIPGFLQNVPLEEHPMPPVAGAPVAAPPAPGFDPEVRREALHGVEGLIQALEQLGEEIEAMPDAVAANAVAGAAAGASAGAPPSGSSSSPAQLVDAVVQTAANGIEDLAAGLMRANELATVAERVTNRATLLALNAALEAQKTSGESMGAIAEETRRLAEYAREATDTISRLAEEIEAKVGETITAIHATSEDAKAGLANLASGSAPAPAAAPVLDTSRAIEAVVAALDRAYDLREKLGGENDGDARTAPNTAHAAAQPSHAGAYAPEPLRASSHASSPALSPSDTRSSAESGAEVSWTEPDAAWADAVDSLTPEQREILERLQPGLKPDQEHRG